MSPLTLDNLVEQYQQVSLSNQRMLEAFGALVTELQRAQVAFILLKGADVLSRLYRIRGLRPFCDIDLLVHAQDLSRLDRLLTSLGFQPEIDGNPSYYSSERGLRLDITTSIWYLNPDGLCEIWDRTIQRTIEANLIRCMCTNDLVLYLTAYNILHRGSCSTTFTHDLRLLIEREPVDWVVVLEQAVRWNLNIPLYYGLTTASRHESSSIPPAVLQSLAPTSITEKRLLDLLRAVVTDKPLLNIGHFLMFITRPVGQKLRWVWSYLSPPREFLRYRYGKRGVSQPLLTSVMRVGWLIAQSVVLISHILLRLLIKPSPKVAEHRSPFRVP